MGLSLPEPFDNLNTNKVWRSKREGYHKMTWKIKWEWFQSIFLKKKHEYEKSFRRVKTICPVGKNFSQSKLFLQKYSNNIEKTKFDERDARDICVVEFYKICVYQERKKLTQTRMDNVITCYCSNMLFEHCLSNFLKVGRMFFGVWIVDESLLLCHSSKLWGMSVYKN